MLGAWRLALLLLLAPLPAAADEVATLSAETRLSEVSVTQKPETTVIFIKTSGAARYHAEFVSSPNRLVVDLEDTVYGWRKTPLSVGRAPLRQVRGSQYRKGVSRVVMEFTQKVGYVIREDPEGLSIVIPIQAAAALGPAPGTGTALPTQTPKGTAEAATVTEAEARPEAKGDTASVSPAGTPTNATSAAATAMPPEPATPVGTIVAAPSAPAAQRAKAAVALQKAEPIRIAQAPTPAPASARSGQRLISLDFKDADIVNLLRILAAESGRNIVIGDDVKGKMSITLRNVPWQLALDTILEARGLEKIEKDGVLRIVTAEQLTREREAKARVEEAKIKGEADARAKLAEAELKEAEASTRKLAAEAARKEQEAKGPLREETVRLSYADPEEVAKTLQGILGIPPTGTGTVPLTGPGFLGLPPNPELGVGYQGAPPFPGAPVPTGPVSVSQDVLNKGLTIRAHKPTNTIFLRLYSADLDRVKKLIQEALDIPLPQVKIEARMEILERTALEQIGVQWGGLSAGNVGRTTTLVGQGLQTTTTNGQTVPFVPGFVQGTTTVIDPTSIVPLNTPNPFVGPSFLQNSKSGAILGGLPVSFQTGLPLGGNLVNLPITSLPNAGPLPAGGINFGIIGKRFNVNLALQALASQGKTRTLARPEIVTVENNKATMSLGEEIPYATISSAGTQIQFKEALLKLEVTPTVIREGDVTKIKMVVIVENNSRGTSVNLGNAGSPPAINKRKAETLVLVREGDRLIIGGVMTSVNQYTVNKVPLLGDIPVLGWLFKQRENFEQGRELVVFLTPSVLRTVAAANPGTPAPPPAPK